MPRRIGIAGGSSKFEAIRAAALGKWVDTLITDLHTAERLLKAHLDLGSLQYSEILIR